MATTTLFRPRSSLKLARSHATVFPAGIRAAPFPAYAWLPPARLLLEPVNGSQTRYVDTPPRAVW